MSSKAILVKKLLDYDQGMRDEAANVFVDGYYNDLSFFSKDKEKLKNAFEPLICADVFYVAEMDGAIVGLLACSHNRQRAMSINNAILYKHLGLVRGNLAYYLLKKEFNTPLSFPDDTAYIECVATSENARGQGVCTALFQHVMQELPYREFRLEVVDTNLPAYRLYQKLGFTEFSRKQVKWSKLKGFHEKINMRWLK